MSKPTTSEGILNATSSPASASGATHCGSQDGQMIDPFGLDPAPASRSVQPEKEQEPPTSAICGLNGSVSSASAALTLSLVSRLKQRSATAGSTLFELTWKESATPSQRPVSLLRASVRRISDNDCGWGGVGGRLPLGRMGNNNNKGLEGQRGGHQAEAGQREGAVRPVAASSESGGVAESDSRQRNGVAEHGEHECDGATRGRIEGNGQPAGGGEVGGPGWKVAAS
jgi:hypothetical protein